MQRTLDLDDGKTGWSVKQTGERVRRGGEGTRRRRRPEGNCWHLSSGQASKTGMCVCVCVLIQSLQLPFGKMYRVDDDSGR